MVGQLETTTKLDESRIPYQIEGLVQVFTGKQRNFFTSVIAQGLQMATHGTPVLVVQFLKGGIGQGVPMRLGRHMDWLRCDSPRCIDTPHLDSEEVAALHRLWHYTKGAIMEKRYSLAILDELCLAVHFGLIPLDEVIDLLRQRPGQIDLILTGPEIPEEILAIADQVTEIRRSYYP